MSYCRFSNGDVYLYFSVGNYISCCGCSLIEDDGSTTTDTDLSQRFYTFTDAIEHMNTHKQQGHKFPDDVIPALVEERGHRGDKDFRLDLRSGRRHE